MGPHQTRAGVGDTIHAATGAAFLVMIELGVEWVTHPTDVDQNVAGVQKRFVARPNNLDLLSENEGQDSVREHIVRVKNAVVGANFHGTTSGLLGE